MDSSANHIRVSAGAVGFRSGGRPLKLCRAIGKCGSVSVCLREEQEVQAAVHCCALMAIPASLVKRSRSKVFDAPCHQPSRTPEKRKMENHKRKLAMQKRDVQLVAPVFNFALEKASEARALREENAALRAQLADVARDNWVEGVRCGKRGLCGAATPVTPGRAGRVALPQDA